ncbi:ABC transporter permease [Hoeflea ulvae]|uniref:ABC transporter permease n=1 Tax=Hoeflea ulvae TaxID=2983764 RepID=A0ABT3YCZ5_9HYPH|nr:ABC transporter permease [Hoeflea ulvae]MCY0093754.1 ABC transporter permease [Hoeflea ulvae]
MARLILSRLLLMFMAMFVVMTAMFFGIRLGGTDPAIAIQGSYATAESVALLSESLGLDKPLWQQYVMYMTGLLRGDLGVSLQNGRPVLQQILQVLPNTFDLTFWGMVIGVVVGVPLGFISAIKRNTMWDQIIRVCTLASISMPPFIIAYLLLIVFAITFRMFPVNGGGDLDDLSSRASHLFLPAMALGLAVAAYIARLTRTSVLEIMSRDFIRTARAKGLSEYRVMSRHVLKLAWVGIVTLIGIYSAVSIGGSVAIELVFGRPGVGRLVIGAISQGDFTVIQGAIIFYAAFVSIVNMIVDVTYTFLDPRIRYT